MAEVELDEQTGEVIETEPEAPAIPGEPDEAADEAGEDAEQEDVGGESEDEAPAEPEGPQPPSPDDMERRQQAWERERDRHMRELEKRDDYRYSLSSVCPLCDGHGLLYTPQTPEEGAQMRATILAMVGETTAEELKPHPRFHRCDTCGGEGKVYTGSKVPGQDALPCPDCNGQGHSGGQSQTAPTPLPVAAVAAPSQPPPSEQERIGNDAWGRPPGHPHYGLLPAQVS